MSNISVEHLEQSLEIIGARLENDLLSLQALAKKATKSEIARAIVVGMNPNVIDKSKLPKLTTKQGTELAKAIKSVSNLTRETILTYLTLEGTRQQIKETDNESTEK